MRKLKILIIQLMGCIVCGIIIGTAFWLSDGGKPCKKVSDCPGGMSNALEMAFKNGWERESRIRELREKLSDHENMYISLPLQTIYDFKNELCILTGKEKPIKIYAGQWIWDTKQVGDYWSVGYLQREVIK